MPPFTSMGRTSTAPPPNADPFAGMTWQEKLIRPFDFEDFEWTSRIHGSDSSPTTHCNISNLHDLVIDRLNEQFSFSWQREFVNVGVRDDLLACNLTLRKCQRAGFADNHNIFYSANYPQSDIAFINAAKSFGILMYIKNISFLFEWEEEFGNRRNHPSHILPEKVHHDLRMDYNLRYGIGTDVPIVTEENETKSPETTSYFLG